MSRGTLKKRGQIWYGRVRYKGQERTRSLETSLKTVARERLAKWVNELEDQNWGKKKRRKFNDASKKFIDEHLPTVRPNSAQRYAVSLAHLIDYFSGLYLDEITSKHLYGFEQKRRKQKVTTSTIRRDLACLSVLFSCAEEWEWHNQNPVKPFLRSRKRKGLVEATPRTRYLKIEEEQKLLSLTPDYLYRMIVFAIDTGLRREEIFSLTWQQVDMNNREIFIHAEKAKSKKQRKVPIAQRTWVMLDKMPRHLKSIYVFNNESGRRYSQASPFIWESLKNACEKAKIEKATWHDLRRTCGCRLLQVKGFSMEEVSRWLGHSSVTVTERSYAFLKEEQLQETLKISEQNIVSLPNKGYN